MAITPTGDGTAVQTIHKEVHKVVTTDEYGNPTSGATAPPNKVVLYDKNGNAIESEEYATDEYSLKTHLTNETIEQNEGDVHSGLTIASGWKDTDGDVAAPLTDTDGHPQVDVLTSPGLTDTELRATPIDTDLQALSGFGNGQKSVTTAGTDEALAASAVVRSVTIKALAGNTGNVYVGESGVDSSTGFVLAAGETISLDIDNLNTVYLDVDTNGEGVSFIYLS